MHKLAYVFAISMFPVVAGSVSAQTNNTRWQVIQASPPYSIGLTYDGTRTSRSANVIDTWIQTQYDAPKPIGPDGAMVASSIQHAVINCSAKQYMVHEVVQYGPTGLVVKSWPADSSDKWSTTTPDAVDEAFVAGVCSAVTG